MRQRQSRIDSRQWTHFSFVDSPWGGPDELAESLQHRMPGKYTSFYSRNARRATMASQNRASRRMTMGPTNRASRGMSMFPPPERASRASRGLSQFHPGRQSSNLSGARASSNMDRFRQSSNVSSMRQSSRISSFRQSSSASPATHPNTTSWFGMNSAMVTPPEEEPTHDAMEEEDKRPEAPDYNAGWMSKLWFHWISAMLWVSCKSADSRISAKANFPG